MQHLLTPYALPVEPFAWWNGSFTEQELDLLQARAKAAVEQAHVGVGHETGEELAKIRRSKVAWVNKTQELAWLYYKLSHIASSLNAKFYRFDLTGFGEPLQLTNYDGVDHGMYGWHQDYGAIDNPSRKLSLVLQLTDPSEYEGGNLQIMVGDTPQTLRKQRGLITAFPSYTVHQVTPVTRGARQSLVAWISGPPFR